MSKNNYSNMPAAYLERARELLQSGEAASLFYAALELRFFVERRQDQYLSAQAEYAQSLPRHWKIGAQGKALEAIFKSNQIQQISWQVGDETIFEVHYVPLSAELRKIAERLGSLLHAQNEWIAPDDPWWDKTWKELRCAYELAWQCSQGAMLSPMVLVGGKAAGKIMLEVNIDMHEKILGTMKMKKGTQGMINVAYLDEPPSEWKSDLTA